MNLHCIYISRNRLGFINIALSGLPQVDYYASYYDYSKVYILHPKIGADTLAHSNIETTNL